MKSLNEAHEALKNKKISCVELAQACLEKTKGNPNNSYISILEDRALKQAKSCDEFLSKNDKPNALYGIPYSLKDLFITKDIRTTAGSKILYNYIPSYQGNVAGILEQAGGVLTGKVGCDEFGMGSCNDQTAFGAVLNPLNHDYVPGGSSGGSAASIVEGSCYYSIGTDTGGSVRLPANFCGLYGFKPSYGRISRYGQIAYASSLDQAAPFGKTPKDLMHIINALTENDNRDSTQVPLGRLNIIANDKFSLKGKKIGFVPELIENCREDVRENLKDALESLKKMGAELHEVSLPHSKYAVAVYYLIATSEASSNLSRFDGIHYGLRKKGDNGLIDIYKESRAEGFGEEVKRRILLGTFSLSSGYSDEYFLKATKVRRLIYEDFQKVFSTCDLFILPTCATTALRKDEKLTPLQMYMNDLYTIPVSLSGLPSIAIPWKKSKENNMPTGFQLVGNSFCDEDVLQAAHQIHNTAEGL